MDFGTFKKIEEITTVKELYQLRAELLVITNSFRLESPFNELAEIQEANYLIKRMEAKVDLLEHKRMLLDKTECQKWCKKGRRLNK